MRKLPILFSTILVVLLALALAVGCQQEPEPSPSPEDGILFQDNFVDNSNNWRVDADSYIGDGAYHRVIHVEEGHQVTSVSLKWPPAAPNFPDFGYEAEVTKMRGDDGMPHGLAFLCQTQKPTKEFYFMICGEGAYIFSRAEGDNITHIIPWTDSPYIEKGNASNKLKVVCHNSIIELYVNDHFLETVSGEFPSDIGDNGIGLVIMCSDDTHIAFDNIKMWVVTP